MGICSYPFPLEHKIVFITLGVILITGVWWNYFYKMYPIAITINETTVNVIKINRSGKKEAISCAVTDLRLEYSLMSFSDRYFGVDLVMNQRNFWLIRPSFMKMKNGYGWRLGHMKRLEKACERVGIKSAYAVF